ncbi:nitroreductase family protein [Micromonosporaceae bacterium Da 78-11]
MNKPAITQVPLHPLLASRWSPRAFDATHEPTPGQLAALLEAARWAASANNTQPWRFLVATRGQSAYEDLYALLAPGNQTWAGAAGALVLVAAETVDADGNPRPFAQYDTGQAVANLVAQAGHEGLIAHQMGGFDRAGAAARFGLPDATVPVVVVAVGRHDPEALLDEPFAAREQAPRTRLTVDEIQLREPAIR